MERTGVLLSSLFFASFTETFLARPRSYEKELFFFPLFFMLYIYFILVVNEHTKCSVFFSPPSCYNFRGR